MLFCQNCGRPMAAEARLCANCGAAAPGFPPSQLAAGQQTIIVQTPRRRMWPRYLLASIATVITLIVIIVFLVASQGEKVAQKLGTDLGDKAMEGPRQTVEVLSADDDNVSSLKAALARTGGTADERLDRMASLIEDYVSEAKQVSIGKCPSDFQEAWESYLSRWSDMAQALASHPHIPTDDESAVNGFLQGFSGDFSGGVMQEQELNAWAERVKARSDDLDKARDRLGMISHADVDAVTNMFKR